MEQKRGGRGNKDFKKLDKLVPGVGTLKRGWGGGAGTPLRNTVGVDGGAGVRVCE